MKLVQLIVAAWWAMLCCPGEWGGWGAAAQTTFRMGHAGDKYAELPNKLMLVPIGYQPMKHVGGVDSQGRNVLCLEPDGPFVWDDEEATPARDRFPVFRGSFLSGATYEAIVLMPDQPFDARAARWSGGGSEMSTQNPKRAYAHLEWNAGAELIRFAGGDNLQFRHTGGQAVSVYGLPFTWPLEHAWKATGAGSTWTRALTAGGLAASGGGWVGGGEFQLVDGEYRCTLQLSGREGVALSSGSSPSVGYVSSKTNAYPWVVYALREDDGAHRDGGTGGDGYERWDDLMDLLGEVMPGMGTSLAAIRWNLEHDDVGIATNFGNFRTEYTEFRTWFQMTFQLTLFQHLTTIATRVLQLHNALNSTDGISAEQWQWENPDHDEWIAEAFSEVDRPFGGPEDMEAAVTALGSDESSAPGWSWSLDLGTLLAPFPVPAPIQYVEFSPNLFYVAEYRPILHAIMIALLSLWGVGRVWDELRRY